MTTAVAPPGAPTSAPNRGTKRTRETTLAWALLAPSLAGILAFLVLPILVVIWLSLNKWDLLAPMRFVGGQNWAEVLTDSAFGESLLITLAFVVMVIPLQTALGLFMAVLLSRGLPVSSLFRVIYVVPWICAPLALGVVWKWIFSPYGGAANALLNTDVEWLSSPTLALPLVAAVSIWSQVGYTTLFFMAGLAGIPPQIIEAAAMDGANGWQTFWRVKLPLLGPTLFFVLVTGVISSFQAFDQIYALTPDGGPDGVTSVIAFRIYQDAFRSFDLGRASVMSLVLFVILIVVTLVQQRFFSSRVTYDLS